jgi:hypothetical protein
MDKEALHTAQWHLAAAVPEFSKAYACALVGQPRPHFEEIAMERLTAAVEALGYDLVKRTDKQQEAA